MFRDIAAVWFRQISTEAPCHPTPAEAWTRAWAGDGLLDGPDPNPGAETTDIALPAGRDGVGSGGRSWERPTKT